MELICILAPFIIFLLAVKYVDTRRLWRSQMERCSYCPTGGYIYFFRGRRESIFSVKMGRTNNVPKRMMPHSTANTHGVYILGVVRVRSDRDAENYIKALFKQQRLYKRKEWFRVTPKLLLFIWIVRDIGLTKEFRELCT